MAVALNPDPKTLGLASPAIGPWFESSQLTLGDPNEDLSVTLDLNTAGETWWMPPAGGTLSLFIAGSSLPSRLEALRKADGNKAFGQNALVALFRLLPEVEERLYILQKDIPLPVDTQGSATAPTRARIRFFALEVTPVPDPNDPAGRFFERVDPQPDSSLTIEKRLTELGLRLESNQVANDDEPMYDFKRPGVFLGSGTLTNSDKLFRLIPGSTHKLWIFDSQGLSLEPGAAASWWHHLGTTVYNNLRAQGLTGHERTVATQPKRLVHIVNPHKTPVQSTGLTLNSLTALGASQSLYYQQNTTQPAAIQAPAASGSPPKKISLLPTGEYKDSLSLWADTAFPLTRDFVRIGYVDLEEHLVGVTAANEHQARKCTRVNVAKTEASLFLTKTDDTAAGILDILQPNTPCWFVAPVLERDWGPLEPSSLPDASLPKELPQGQLYAVHGGGQDQGGLITDQKAVLEFTFTDSNLNGAWIRAWTQGFDQLKGWHYRTNGGGGRLYFQNQSEGKAFILLSLPPGSTGETALLGFDILFVTAQGSRLFADMRWERPVPVGGNPLSLNSLQAGDKLILCETGQELDAPQMNQQIPSGVSLVVKRNDQYHLVDRQTIGAAHLSPQTLLSKLHSQARLELTKPAWQKTPAGDSSADLTHNGSTVHESQRGLNDTRDLEPGSPLPHQERLELMACSLSQNEAQAVIGSTPPLSRYHEAPHHQTGHPGVPASLETHGAGIKLSHRAALMTAELVRDRMFRSTYDLLSSLSQVSVPQNIGDPAEAGCWAAVVKTVAPGVEGEIGLGEAVSQIVSGGQNIFNTLEQVTDSGALSGVWNLLSSVIGSMPNITQDQVTQAVRLLARRLLVSAYGAQETARSLKAAFSRAETLVYIETPAFDNLALKLFDPTNNPPTKSLLSYLEDRMTERPGLRVLICVPRHTMPGTPQKVEKVRNEGIMDGYVDLINVDMNRALMFKPLAGMDRTLRITSTTVIVDDVYALTGTTHLWRKGLTYDSSVAVAALSEKVSHDGCQEIREFRKKLIAARLGLTEELVPDCAEGLLESVRLLDQRQGLGRVAAQEFALWETLNDVTNVDKSALNPDATLDGFDILDFITGLALNTEEVVPDSYY